LSVLQLGGLLLAVSAANSFASLMPVGPMTFSSNVGTFPTVLTIQNMDTASGCVGFMGGSDLSGLAACPGGFTGSGGNEVGTAMQTGTRTIAQLNAAGITTSSNLLLVFHPSELGGGSITIQDLALTFFNVTTDNTFTATLPGTPMNFASTSAGSSGNTGFAFRLDDFEAGLAAEFFANPANRVGGAATITGSAGGAAAFSLASMRAVRPSAVPEPSTVLYFAAAGLVMGGSRRIRRRKT